MAEFPKEIHLQGNLKLNESRTVRDPRFHIHYKEEKPGPTQRPNNSIPLLAWFKERIEEGDIEFPSEEKNIYTDNGTLLDDRELQGDGKNLNFVNVRSFSVQADPQENDSHGLAFGNYTEAGVKAYTGIIIGGLGKNNGTYISGQTEGQDGENTAGVYISGINTNSEARDIILNPQNGKIQITNLPDDNSAPKVVGQDSNGNLCLVEPGGSGESVNIYNSDGTLETDRTVNGAGYFLKFENLNSFLAQTQSSKFWMNSEEQPGFFNGFYSSGIGNFLLEIENWSSNIEPGIKIYTKESKGTYPVAQFYFGQHEGPSEAVDLNVYQYHSGSSYPRLGGGIKAISRGDAYGLKLILDTNTNAGNSAIANDLDIEFVTGRAILRNLPTDNTANQVLAKDANGRLCWRDVSSL